MVLLTGCGSNYAYRPGSLASEENQRRDLDACRDKAWNAYFESNNKTGLHGSAPIPIGYSPLTGLAIAVIGAVAVGTINEATREPVYHGPALKESDTDVLINKCMTSKGYVNKD